MTMKRTNSLLARLERIEASIPEPHWGVWFVRMLLSDPDDVASWPTPRPPGRPDFGPGTIAEAVGLGPDWFDDVCRRQDAFLSLASKEARPGR
jgi:hypothetical protein